MAAIIDYRGKTPTKTSSGIPLITAKIVKGGRIDDPSEFIDPLLYDTWMTRGLPERGDVVLTTEAPLGEVAQLDDRKVALAQRIITLRGKPDQLVNGFLKYSLQSEFVKAQLHGRASGSTVSGIKQSELRKVNLRLPPIEEQHAIALLLGALDDKIDLNRRMNETLEHLARALFKDWFVDFGPTKSKMAGREAYLEADLWALFPERLDEERKPEEWTQELLGDLFDISIGRTPPRKEKQHFVPGGQGRTWLSIKTMGGLQVFSFDSEEDLTPDAVSRFRVPLIPAGTVIVSFKLTVGRVAIAANDMHSNEAIAHLVPHRSTPVSTEYTYLFMSSFDYSTLGSTSSIATAVNSQSIKAIKMLVAEPGVQHAFTRLVTPLLERIKGNGLESRTLAQTRDLLLPKLMSGEVRLGDAEKIVGNVL